MFCWYQQNKEREEEMWKCRQADTDKNERNEGKVTIFSENLRRMSHRRLLMQRAGNNCWHNGYQNQNTVERIFGISFKKTFQISQCPKYPLISIPVLKNWECETFLWVNQPPELQLSDQNILIWNKALSNSQKNLNDWKHFETFIRLMRTIKWGESFLLITTI